MELINFKLSGKFAHFLRAESSASALSYPFPPRTVILGILGAVLGIPKDKPQEILEPAKIAISGKLPETHWHRVKFRKDPPPPLPLKITRKDKSEKNTKPEKATLILQEWLFKPSYNIWTSVPEPFHSDLKLRLQKRRWYFTPYLGLSEMIADIEYMGSHEALPLPKGSYNITTIFPQGSGEIEMEKVFQLQIAIHRVRMPRSVTADRIFRHTNYFAERDARAIPVITDNSYKISGGDEIIIMFL